MQFWIDLLSKLGRPTWFGLARISIVAVVTLVAIGVMAPMPIEPAPWNTISAPAHVFTMALHMSDPRGFKGLDEHDDTGKFQIAWISGSGTQVLYPLAGASAGTEINEFMPMHVQPKLAAAFGEDVEILLYVLQAGTSIDKSLALIDARRRNVDLIVYEVNPAYDFSTIALTRRQNLAGTAARLSLTDPSLALQVFSAAAPNDLVASLLRYRLPAISDRLSYRRALAASVPSILPSVQVPPPLLDPDSDEARIAATPDSWTFWARYNHAILPRASFKNPCLSPDSSGVTGWCSNVENSLAAARPDLDIGAGTVTEDNIRRVMTSGQSSIVYLSPIDPVRRDEFAEIYGEVIARLKGIAADVGPGNYCLKTDYSPDVMERQMFSDMIHLRRSEPMASDMSATIIDWVKNRKCR